MSQHLPFAAEEERFLADIAAYLESDDPLPALGDSLERDLDDVLALDRSIADLPPDDAKGSAGADAKPKRHRAKRSRNLVRERMQAELRDLRLQSTELEQQVSELKKQRTLSTGEELLLASWKQIAVHQRDERREAEEENMRLKHKLQTQMALARELCQSAQVIATGGAGEPAISVYDGYLLVTGQIPRQTCTDAHAVAMFSAMFKEADLVYTEMDAVLQHSGLREWQVATNAQSSAAQASVAKRRTIASLDGSIAIELASAKVYAFTKDIVFRAMWETWEEQYLSGCVLFDIGELHPHNGIAATIESTLDMNGERVTLRSIAVIKAFPGPDGGFRHVWRTMCEASSHFPGVCIQETGWEELGSTPDGGAVVLTCSHLRSKTATESAFGSPAATEKMAPLADLLAASYEAEIDEVDLRLEGLVLDDGVKH